MEQIPTIGAWRSYQEGTESSEDLTALMTSPKAKLSEKDIIRQMLCRDPCCEVCDSAALKAALLYKSPLPQLASWTLPSNLNLVPSPSHNPVASDQTSLNPSPCLATSTLPGHTTSIAPIPPVDLNFTLPHSSTPPIMGQSYSQSISTSRAHILVLAHTSTVVHTSAMSDTSLETVPPLVPRLTEALTPSLPPNHSLASSMVQTPSMVPVASMNPPNPEASTPSPIPGVPQEPTSHTITHPSLKDLQLVNNPLSSAPTPLVASTLSTTPTLVASLHGTVLHPPVPLSPPAPLTLTSPLATPPAFIHTPSVPPTLSLNPSPHMAPPPSIIPTHPVAPPPSIFPIPLVTPTPCTASDISITPIPSLNSTLPITPTLSFAPGLPVAPVPPVAPSPVPPVTPTPYFPPIPSVTPGPPFAPSPFYAPSPFFAPTPPFAPAASVAPALSMAPISPIAQTSILDPSFLIDRTHLCKQPQICHSPSVAHTSSLNPSYSKTYITSVASTSSFTSSKAPSMAPISSRRPSFSSPSTSSIVPLKISAPSRKPARTSRFHTSSIASKASISRTSSLDSPLAPKASMSSTSSIARTLGETLTSSLVHVPSLVHMTSMVCTTMVSCTGSTSHTSSQASPSSTICTPSLVHTPLIACASFTSPTTSVAPTFSQASPHLEEKICSQILRSSLFHSPSEEAHIHSPTQTTSVAATSLENMTSSQALKFSLAGGTLADHNPSRAHVQPTTHRKSLNFTSPAHTVTPSRNPLMSIKDPPMFLKPPSLVDFQLPQQSSLTPRSPNSPLAPSTCGKPEVLGSIPRVLSTDDATLMTSAPLTSDIDESHATFSGISQQRNSQEYLILPYLLLWASKVEPLSLDPSEAYPWRQNRKQNRTLPILMPEKPSDHKSSEQQQKNLVPLRLQLSEQTKNTRAQQHAGANKVPRLSSSAQEFLEMHITEKTALHIWKEKELLSQATADLPPCFHHRELEKFPLVLEDTEPSAKDLWTPDPQYGSSDQHFLGSKTLGNHMKPEQMSSSQQPYTPLSLILAPSTLHFLNRLCSMPGWSPESTISHNQQYIQLFWGLPSLHSESLATSYMGSSSSSRQEARIKLLPEDNASVFFNDLCYLHLSNSANQPTLPSPTQNFKLLPNSLSTSSHPPSLPHSPTLSPIPPPPSPSTPPMTSYPLPSPVLSSSPTLVRTLRTDPEETSIRIPTIHLPKFQALEWHLLQKQLQSLWGVPHVVQRSYKAFYPLPVRMPQFHKSPLPQVQVSNWPQEIPFLSKDVKKLLETHLRRRLLQHHWSLAWRMEDSIKHLLLQTIPQEDPARSKRSKPSTFLDLKHSGKRDTASDSVAILGVASGIMPETGPTMHAKESPKNDLEKSPAPSKQEISQKHLIKKSLAIQQKVVPERVCRSWARYQSISLQPGQTPPRPLKMKEIVPNSPYMEDIETQTQSQTEPKSEIQPQPQFRQEAPSPTEEVIYQVETCKDIPFLNLETKKLLESHIRHLHIRAKWGLPRKVLESIYLFKLKNPSSQVSPIHWLKPYSRIGERNLQELWVGGVAREAPVPVLDILEAEKSSWNIVKELGKGPQAGGDWEQNIFSPRPCQMDRGPREHMTEMGSRRKILELNMKHPALLQRQKDLAPRFRRKLQAKEKQEHRVIALFEENERAYEGERLCLLQIPCALNKVISFSKLNFHLKKRIVEKVLGIPLRVRESRELATRKQLQLPPSLQVEAPLAGETTESFPGPSHEREIKDSQKAEGRALCLSTLDLSSLLFKAQLNNEEEFHPRVLEQSHVSDTLVYPHALGFQATVAPRSYSLQKPNEKVTGTQEPGPLGMLKGKGHSLREYQKLYSPVTRKKQAKWVQSQRKGNLSKPKGDRKIGDGEEKNPNLLKGHTSDSKCLSQGTMSRVVWLTKPEGVLQQKTSLEIRLAQKMKGFFRWLCPKKKIKGSEEPFPRVEAAISGKETTEETPFMVKSLSKESEAPFSSEVPSTSENMVVVGLILKKGLVDACEENQQQERELQPLKTQSEPTGHKMNELRAHSSAKVQESNGESRDHRKGSEAHWSWGRQTQEREKRVKGKTLRFRDLPSEKLASLASEVSISSGQICHCHKGSSFTRTGGHSKYHPKLPLGGSFQRDSPGPSQYGVLWLPPRESSHPGENLFS
ncbi:uncharacterized protein LOC141495349 [Macrotis lagotis]|uniref:uncharacterized protein LOC141495349 n=1 Tax=Macrotis lagotis TaxID=92651 RepID=UPI003D69C8E8